MFVKICGLSTEESIAAAVHAGADAIGFVFADSPRQVSPARASKLAADVPAGIAKVAVTRHPDRQRIDEIFSAFEPDYLQSEAEDFAAIELPAGCAALPVVRSDAVPIAAAQYPRLLFEGPVSGRGRTADWQAARGLSGRTQLILAGGLTPANIADAIATVRPWGVDVSSGVERRPGVKDPRKIIDFVARVRAVEKDK